MYIEEFVNMRAVVKDLRKQHTIPPKLWKLVYDVMCITASHAYMDGYVRGSNTMRKMYAPEVNSNG